MKSISFRLLAIMLSINVLGMGSIALTNGILSSQSIREQSIGRVSETTALKSGEINNWLRQELYYISSIAIDFASLTDLSDAEILATMKNHVKNDPDYLCVYIGYPDGTGIFSDDWIPDNDWKANERDWYKAAAANTDKSCVTDIYVDATTGEFVITVVRAIMRNGQLFGVAAIDIYATVIGQIIEEIDVGEGSYAFLTDNSGNIISHKNADYMPYIDEDENTLFKNIFEVDNNIYSGLSGIGEKSVAMRDADGVKRYLMARNVESANWMVYTAIPTEIIDGPIKAQIIYAAVIFVVIFIFAVIFIYLSIRTLIIRPIKDVTFAANALAQGESGTRLDGKYVGEIAQLADSFRSMERFNRQQTEWLEHIAGGDLSINIKPRGVSDRIGRAVADMLSHLNEMFEGINQNSNQVAISASSIADSAQMLAEGSNEQTSVIERLSNSVNSIMSKTGQNADIAREAAELSGVIRKKAENGSTQMDSMMQAVREINDASARIEKVIKVIDDIASQTNILALNAAVEAARAGEHGKGFAVVAEEVRNLSAKSAEAAKDTDALIVNSIEKANLGLDIATATSESLKEIVDGINRSAEIAAQIAGDSEEQTVAIRELNIGIGQVSQIVQQNSAVAEESSAASGEMSGQSRELKELISRFKMKD